MQNNANTYAELVLEFLEKVPAYLQQFDSEIGRQTKKGVISHFDYKLPFKENPAKVRNLDILHLKDVLRNHEFSTENVVAFVRGKNKMIKLNFSLLINSQ